MCNERALYGNSVELIQSGKQKIIFAGGSEEIHWAMTAMFDAMTALSSKYNETPEKSRAYDKTRDGFVISGGGGVLVLKNRACKIKRCKDLRRNYWLWSHIRWF